MNTPIQPGLLRIFRYFTGIAMGYYAAVVVVSAAQNGHPYSASQMQIYLNLVTNLGLSLYLSWGWLQRRLKIWYLPIALLAATIIPIFSNLFFLAEPIAKDLSLVIAQSWLLFPILIVPMVLIAWQYGFLYVLAFTVVTAAVELGVLYPVVGRLDFETLPILGLPLIRAFAFGTVGHIVANLIATQQAQSKALLKANYRLNLHAETLEQLAVSRERNRLARELHDTLAHTLSGQAVNLEAIKLMVPPEQAEILGMLDQALENTRRGLHETRRALKDLRSLPLENLGLALAICNQAKDSAARAAFDLHLDMPESLPTLPPEIEQCVFRIAQESLENIIRHANASRVSLRLGMIEGRLQLEICDDGVGAALDELDLHHKLGLHGMRERAAEAGGSLEVFSQPGQGMTIRFSIQVLDDPNLNL
jgi:signal transduction histidine kinase